MSKINNEEGNYVTVAGKISTWCFGRLSQLLKKRGINAYQWVQNTCYSAVKHMDDRHNLTPESEKVIGVFEGMVGWKDNFTLADPQAKPEVAEATYYLSDENGKKGVVTMHVERPFFGQWKQTFNVQQIMERFLCLTFPQLYKRLRFIAVCRQCANIYELMLEVAAELEEEEQKKELLKDFDDNDRGDWGQKPGNTRYKRKAQLTPDMFESHEQEVSVAVQQPPAAAGQGRDIQFEGVEATA